MFYYKTNTIDGAVDNLFNLAFGLREVDYEARDNEYLFALPGFSKEDLDIQIDGRILSISAEVEAKHENRFKKSFSKRYTLANDVDTDSISARMENGILTIHFGKGKEAKKVTVL
jgi:HSP20 family molecular chaperone IbpA